MFWVSLLYTYSEVPEVPEKRHRLTMANWSTWKSICLLILVINAVCLPIGYFVVISWEKYGESSSSSTEVPLELQGNYPREYSSGIMISEEIPTPIYYQTYVPLFLEHELPNYVELVRSLKSHYSSVCGTTSEGDSPVSDVNDHFCDDETDPNWKLLKTLLESELLGGDESGQFPDIDLRAQKFSYEDGVDFCSEIKGHFTDSVMEAGNLKKYKKLLANCRADRFLTKVFFRNNIDFKNVTFSPENSIEQDILQNNLSVYGNVLINLVNNRRKWQTRFDKCKSGRILYNPFTFSDENSNIFKALTYVEERLGDSEIYELSIPSEHIDEYKSLTDTLTDCVFTTNNTFVERVLLPIVPRMVNYLTFTVKAVPFIIQNSGNSELCFLKDSDNRKFIYEEQTERFMDATSCTSQKLCKVSQLFELETLQERNCISSLFFNDTESIAQFCRFECQAESQNADMFRRVSSDSVVLFSVTPKVVEFFYKCKGDNKSYSIQTSPDDVPTLMVTLPCNCRLYNKLDEIFHSIFPCNNGSASDANITQILPLPIYNLSKTFPQSTVNINVNYESHSDSLFLIITLAVIVMLIFVSLKLCQQDKQIEILKHWHDNESGLQGQYYSKTADMFSNKKGEKIPLRK